VLSTVVAEVVATAAADHSLVCAVDPKVGIVGAAALHRPHSAGWRRRLRWLRVAVALAPDAGWHIVRAPRAAITAALHWFALRRLRARLPRHRHLALIGVRRQQRGVGIGSGLLAEVLRRTDRAGVGCALETNSPVTRDWYASRGFRSRAALRWAGRTTWLMYRPPYPAKERI
jgi:GNAT superfamily N-acetyltransferase